MAVATKQKTDPGSPGANPAADDNGTPADRRVRLAPARRRAMEGQGGLRG